MSDAAHAPLPFKMARLRIMMFMEYAVRGVWLPLAARFLSASPEEGGLGFTDQQIGYTVGVALALGAIFSPFIAGPLADRRFATQKFMAVLLLCGGVIKIFTAYQTSFSAWMGLSIVYAILFVPTMSLSNSLAMSHMDDPRRQFPGVRVWGTIAWIVVSWVFPMLWLQNNLTFQSLPPFFAGDDVPMKAARMLDSVKVAGVLAIIYGVFCWFCLPDTPPKREVKSLALSSAFRIYTNRSMAILLVSTLLVGTVHFLYFYQTSKFLKVIGLNDAYIMPAMSIGQFAEIGAMAALGLLLRRIGFRNVILIGAGCYVLRYLVFAGHELLPLSVIVASQALHGPCFACFYAAGFIYVDRMAPADAKHSAQTIFGLMCFGIGPLTAGQLNGSLAAWCTPNGGVLNYSQFWLVAAGIGLIGLAVLALLFTDESPADPAADHQVSDA
ncbi:MAG: MFS transporter [Planctomycetota bacterium]|nr:MFS transporter [Planctomycetota bacterium]